MRFEIFSSLIKKVDKFQLRLKTAASLFPFSWGTFLIVPRIVAYRLRHTQDSNRCNLVEKSLSLQIASGANVIKLFTAVSYEFS